MAGLYALQHRGQESCGIIVAVGHVRYGTTGGSNLANCQPIQVNHLKGKLALAHNGNLSNALQLRRELELSGAIFHTTSDTETIAYVVTRERITTPFSLTAVTARLRRGSCAFLNIYIFCPAGFCD